MIRNGHLQLSTGPTVNHHRPAIDAMFASAARWFGPSATAVVLSGLLDDGAVGAALVARAGGRVLVQDPREASFPSMPSSAWAAVPEALPVTATHLAATIAELPRTNGTEHRSTDRPRSGTPEGTGAHPPTELVEESTESMAASDNLQYLAPDEGALTRLTCPECGGALAEVALPHITFYRCHVGHQYAPQSLAVAQRDSVEAKLWAAVAALEEHAVLARHLTEAHQRTPSGHHDDPPIDYRTAATLARALRNHAQCFSSPPISAPGRPDISET